MKKIICITLLAFAATCKIVPHNPVVPGDESYQPPTLQFNENSIKDGDTIASDEAVWYFTGSLGDRNQYQYKLDNNNWSEWQKVKNIGTEVRLMLTRADTGKHVIYFQSCYHPNNNDFTDTSFSFVKINVPLIILNPSDLTVNEGQMVSFSIVANGTTLSYQWQKDTVNIEGATSSMLSIPSAKLEDGSRYRCIVYNIGGLVVSGYAKLTVNKKIIPPLIATQPENKSVTEGQPVTFTVAATGTDLIYQWKKGSAFILGAISASYIINAATFVDSGATFSCVISNSADTVTSSSAVLSVQKKVHPPVITSQPENQSIAAGKTVTFAVTATGTDIHYQWRKDSVKIANATSATLTIFSVSTADNGAVFSCVIWNAVDTIISNNALLTVVQNSIAPVITVQPVTTTVTAGQNVSFSLTATGTDLHYQWYKDTTILPGAVSALYTIPVVTLADSGKKFKCVVYNPADTVVSVNAELIVVKNIIKPVITTNPESKTVSDGQPVTFIVKATGSDLKFQWQKNSSNITGATLNTYTIATATLSDNGAVFKCVVYNEADTINSSTATLTITQNTVPPAITVQPADQIVTAGQSVSFTVTATGTTLVYQWKKGSTPISGATAATYTLPTVALTDDGGEYSCVVSNTADTVTSRAAKLSVTQSVAPPVITIHPAAASVKISGTAIFVITATGTDLKYQWQKGTTDIPGANTSTLSMSSVTSSENGTTYQCIVSNTADTVVSNPAILTVVYTICYIGNGNETGNVPSDTVVYPQNGIVTINGNSGLLTRTGYTFTGWNRLQNGTGKTYQSADTLLIGSQNVQLYAKWNIDSFTVSFNSNGGSAVATKTVAYGGYASEPAVPTKAGFVFGGWFSNQSLTTTFDFLTAITISRTLYAKWNPVYKVFYHANGANGQVPVDNNQYQSGQVVTLLDRPTGLTRQYYDFTGWNTASNGIGTNRSPGTTFQIGSKNDTLYANWQISRPTITVQPVSLSPYPLDSISFAVTAEGIGLSYLWQKDGTDLQGATNTIFTKGKVNFTDSGYYRCVVSNVNGNIASSSVKLAVRTTVKDADSNVYQIVVIGSQVWTVENLRTTTFNDGNPIGKITEASSWGTVFTPAYCFYGNTENTAEKQKLGALYNWPTVNRGTLAPVGWHVPTNNDWDTLKNFLIASGYNYDGSTVGNKVAKAMASKTEWKTDTTVGVIGNNLAANNISAFTALPAGYRDYSSGEYIGKNERCVWWSSTEAASSDPNIKNAVSKSLFYDVPSIYYSQDNMRYGYSVRLVKN